MPTVPRHWRRVEFGRTLGVAERAGAEGADDPRMVGADMRGDDGVIGRETLLLRDGAVGTEALGTERTEGAVLRRAEPEEPDGLETVPRL
ncbi:MAG: hypothetical protein KDM81_14520 [Verrucomicrobiae bacterium]|nr:hypothetical protein [Verrucomicrobiae bacterium]